MIEKNINSLFLPEKIIFQNEMTLDKGLDISPLKNVRIPIAPLLKLAKEIGDKKEKLDFNGVKIVRIRDYDKHEEVEISIEEVINSSSE